MTNTALWDSLSRPPEKYLRTITAGRLKGKSDINPQWRYLAMTERFGPCGVGWKFTIQRQWTETGADDEVFAFVNVDLFVRVDGQWSEAIPGLGGHKLVIKESSGRHNNDEAWKMACTDALGNAMKYIGMAADVFLGAWDGSKYSTPAAAPPRDIPNQSAPVKPAPANPTPAKPSPASLIREEAAYQISRIPEAKRKELPDGERSWFQAIWVQASRSANAPPKFSDLTLEQYKAVVIELNRIVDSWLAVNCPESEMPYSDIGGGQ